MAVKNYISEEDLIKIDNYRNYYLNKIKCPAADLLTTWERAKSQFLFKLFGDKLILTKKMVDNMDNREGRKQCRENDDIYKFIKTLQREMYQRWGDDWGIPDYSEIFLNSYSQNYTFELSGGKKYKATIGTKTMKVLGVLAKEFGLEEEFEKARLAQSMIRNRMANNTIEMCLSIHPLDYMTMSDNPYDWSSCMYWGDGCYRQGTVEMMNSPVVVVGYVKGSRNLEFNGDTWNGKRWRDLFIIDNNFNFISETKPYPYYNDKYSRFFLNWIAELIGNFNGKKFHDVVFNAEDEPEWECPALELRTETCWMYNDIDNNNDQLGMRCNDISLNSFYINYSGQCQCMVCGDYEVEHEDTLVCEDCSGTSEMRRCGCCGERHYDDFLTYVEATDLYVCDDCLNEYYSYDCWNEEYIQNGAAMNIAVAFDGSMELSEFATKVRSSRYSNAFVFQTINRGDIGVFLTKEVLKKLTDNRCVSSDGHAYVCVYLNELTENGLNLFELIEKNEWHTEYARRQRSKYTNYNLDEIFKPYDNSMAS